MAKNVSNTEFDGRFLTWHMGIKLDSDGIEFEIDVEIDCQGVTLEDALIVCGGGQSTRVRVQSLIRAEGRQKIESYVKDGYKRTWKQVYAGVKKSADPEDLLMRLSKPDFIEFMHDKMGVDKAQAEKIYNFKHGLN